MLENYENQVNITTALRVDSVVLKMPIHHSSLSKCVHDMFLQNIISKTWKTDVDIYICVYVYVYVSEHSVCWRFGVWGPRFKSCIQQRNTTCLLSI